MPKKPTTHIQNTAPGPPKATAVPTPAMLPVPMVADRAVAQAVLAFGDTAPALDVVIIDRAGKIIAQAAT